MTTKQTEAMERRRLKNKAVLNRKQSGIQKQVRQEKLANMTDQEKAEWSASHGKKIVAAKQKHQQPLKFW